jgi:hypothetical protein
MSERSGAAAVDRSDAPTDVGARRAGPASPPGAAQRANQLAQTSLVVLGVRHHGPGSARAVARALGAYRPEVVLIEGPPEADALVGLAASADLRPPVALLAYPLDGPVGGRAAFWPFAEFSPEWQAIRWAVGAGVPVRFCDLPAAYRLAPGPTSEPAPGGPDAGGAPDPGAPEEESGPDAGGEPAVRAAAVRADPIAALAEAAGYDDPERWWEDVVEHRFEEVAADDPVAAALEPFAAIAEAMTEVRAGLPLPPGEEHEEARREAYMRTVLRAATKEHARVAVVCGAWHVPALTGKLPTASADAAVLRGLPKAKVAATWVPWTHGRLASWQGYGAGVRSPGWYHHLFTTPDRPVERWLVRVAAVLRAEDLPVSSAHVIEATRLAEALAALRGRPLPGLSEVTEATRSVLCEGAELRVELINRKVIVGERLGRVPDDTPAVPLARDVAALQRRLKLAPEALVRDLDLDLRKEFDLERSRLLHRLRLLGVSWGSPTENKRGKGTFWESWRLAWQPELAVELVEASAYGTTVAAAAAARVAELATDAGTLAEVTELAERCLLADLPSALDAVLGALRSRAALDTDVAHLMAALPALARTLRYGDVRGTDTGALRTVAEGLLVRICVGLPVAVSALDDTAATALRQYVDAVNDAVPLLDRDGGAEEGGAEKPARDRWLDTLDRLAGRDDLHGLLAGRLSRLLLDAGRLAPPEAHRRLGLVLTVGVPPARGAAWIEGFLAGGGLLLVHDERLLRLVDGWLAGIHAETFIEVLPLLRRTFGTFAAPERRAIGDRARRLDSGTPSTVDGDTEAVDPERGALVLPTVALLLGWDRVPELEPR